MDNKSNKLADSRSEQISINPNKSLLAAKTDVGSGAQGQGKAAGEYTGTYDSELNPVTQSDAGTINQNPDRLGTIRVSVEIEVEPDDGSAASDIPDVLRRRLSESTMPLVSVKGTKFMYMGEEYFCPGPCNTHELGLYLTPYPFLKDRSLESLSDADLIAAIDEDVSRRILGQVGYFAHISATRVLSINRKPQLPARLTELLQPFNADSARTEAIDWSTGVLDRKRLSVHANIFASEAKYSGSVPKDGIYGATVEKVTIEKDKRDVDGWSALILWRIEGKDGDGPCVVSRRWYYPVNPGTDSRNHIFELLRPWLGNDALLGVDFDLHTLVGMKCKLVLIQEYVKEYYEYSTKAYFSIVPSIWAVLPADFQMK